jgi:hypothetical protein
MAHYVAELIEAAESESVPAKKAKAKREAMKAILEIWEHREVLPSHAYPLARFDGLFRILDRFVPTNDPFPSYFPSSENRITVLSRIIFNSSSRLIAGLLLLQSDFLKNAARPDQAAIDALEREEQRIWISLEQWIALFSTYQKEEPSTEETPASGGERRDVRAITLQIVEELTDELNELRTELQISEEEAASEPGEIHTQSFP